MDPKTENQVSKMEDIEYEGSQTPQESRKRPREDETTEHASKKLKIENGASGSEKVNTDEAILKKDSIVAPENQNIVEGTPSASDIPNTSDVGSTEPASATSVSGVSNTTTETNQTSANTISSNEEATANGQSDEKPKRLSSVLERLKQKLESTVHIVQNIPKPKGKGGRPRKSTPSTPSTPASTPSKGTKKRGRTSKKDGDFLLHAPIEFKAAYTLIDKTMQHSKAWPFNAPVNADALKLYDYHTIIKKPMDLGTIKTNILSGKYKSIEDIRKDAELVFSNCRAYNPPRSEVVLMAKEVHEVIIQGWPLVIKAKQNNIDTSEEIQSFETTQRGKGSTRGRRGRKPGPAPANTATTKKTKKETMVQPTAVVDTPQTTTKKRGRKPSNQATTSLPEPTFHEKKKLTEDLAKMDIEQNSEILRILKSGSNSAYITGDAEQEVEVDIDKVDVHIFREIQSYVKACLETKPKNPYYNTKPAEPINGIGEETDTSSDDSDSSSDDDSSDDENKHVKVPISMSTIERRSIERKRKNGGFSSNKHRAHFSIEDAVVFKRLNPPILPIQVLPIEKEEVLSPPTIYSPTHSIFDVSKYLTFPLYDVKQWKKLVCNDNKLIADNSSLSSRDLIVLKSIGAQLENDEVSNKLWNKYRNEFFIKQRQEALKQKKLEEQRLLKLAAERKASTHDFEDFYEHSTEGLDDPFGSFM